MYSLSYYKKRALSGQISDVDFLMNQLQDNDDICSAKIIDYSLGLVTDNSGVEQIKYYLFNGSKIQRNYAAVYFKRKKDTGLLKLAVSKGLIETELAFSK